MSGRRAWKSVGEVLMVEISSEWRRKGGTLFTSFNLEL
jgi:hypothetical protein